jgi:2-phosphosulfolactate phosphatase
LPSGCSAGFETNVIQQLHTHFLPDLVSPPDLKGKTVVVVDVLRATTTIAHALAAGAVAVIPCLEIEEARQIADEQGRGAVLGGERRGLQIEGFDLGNSPSEYTPQTVGGKCVVFTTTNGTRAMRHCSEAARILLGAFVNLSALCDQIIEQAEVAIVCAGTAGEITREDALFAGAVARNVRSAYPHAAMNDQSMIAMEAWSRLAEEMADGTPLHESLRSSIGGQNLLEIGLERDVEIAAAIDQLELVPELDLETGRIRES